MKNIIIIIAVAFIAATGFAQVPEKISYQAVIRNNVNALVSNQVVGMRISILQGGPNGQLTYSETHTPTTNENGLASIEIGGGTIVYGVFSNIAWSSGSLFLKVEVDPNGSTNYSISGTSQLLSVPYALYAKRAETANNTPLFTTGTENRSTDASGVYDVTFNSALQTTPFIFATVSLRTAYGTIPWGATLYASISNVSTTGFRATIYESGGGGGTNLVVSRSVEIHWFAVVQP